MAKFFIDRPVFAWVIAIIIMLAGLLSISRLPIEQYPNIAPPSINIRASYPGASSEVIENSVTQVIEQKLTGIDNLRYFSSNSSDNSSSITLTFDPGTNPDIAQVQTQNKIQSAIAQLPSQVQNLGVSVTKSNDGFLLIIGLYSKDGTVDQRELSDISSSQLQDFIARINGVGSVTVFGEPHAIRIWLNPQKLLKYKMTAEDVRSAISAQNIDVSAGQIGGLPATEEQQINAAISVQTKLENADQFKDIILRVNSDGSPVRLKDVARIELGSQGYKRIVRYKRMPATGVAVSLASGANALKTADLVKEKVNELKKSFPAGVDVIYPFDTTPFIKISIEEVVKTLIEAIILVFLVMLLFLQNLRATFIPTIAVPIVILGTFAILSSFGFTINVLTMFAMVLAIGLLVDDAIVVVENVERIMSQEGLSPKEATKKSMTQITPALIGIALVLSSVFVPMAFFSGAAGKIYQQFSVTIVSAMLLSVVVAIVVSPVLCATLLKPLKKGHVYATTGFFGWFNRKFNSTRNYYHNGVEEVSRKPMRSVAIYFAIILITGVIFARLPSTFLPNEDQGVMYLLIKSPPGSTAQRTLKSVKKVEDHFLNNESDNIQDLFTVTGFSFAGSAQNTAFGFVGLKDWSQRTNRSQSVFAISGRSFPALMSIKDAMSFSFFPPPIRELGVESGFDFQLVDLAGVGHETMINARNQMLGMASQNKKLVGVRPNGLEDVAQYKIDIDFEKASALNLSIADINRTLQIAFGSDYVNDFIDKGRVKRVYIQADAPYRMMPEDINQWYARNKDGKMISFQEFSSGKWINGSPKLERFNGLKSVNIVGAPAPGVSSGEALLIVEKLAQNLPKGVGLAWSGLSYEEKLGGAQAPALYALSILIVFLCLAALYESWTIPFSVILTIPIGIFGASIATKTFHLSNDIYFQVALLTTIGLTAKNAILIVEFAKKLYESGEDLFEATFKACKARFRPIIMTSFAFILGVTPLAMANGAGSAAQNSIGIAVMGGMIAATFIAIFFVPLFYILIEKIFSKSKAKNNEASEDDSEEGEEEVNEKPRNWLEHEDDKYKISQLLKRINRDEKKEEGEEKEEEKDEKN